MTYITNYPSPIGTLTIASDGTHITGLWTEEQRHFGTTACPPLQYTDDLPVFGQVKIWLEQYFAGNMPSAAEIPVHTSGTSFQESVWAVLREIPYSTTVTYGEIAVLLSNKSGKVRMSPQAVGNAVGRNPISILIPCHRVVGKGGSLVGYAGGIDKKKWLLKLESKSKTLCQEYISKEAEG